MLNISEKYSFYQYNYEVNAEKVKQKVKQSKRNDEEVSKRDTVNISEAGQSALKNKMTALSTAGISGEVRKLSSVSQRGYFNDFERTLSELSGSTVSDNMLLTENYSQEKVNSLKSKFETKEDTKTDCFDCYVNKMASVYNLMNNVIEEKYSNPDREQEYYVADDGSIQELTKEKEMEMLNNAYEKHSEFMAASTEIWANLQDFKPQVTYDSKPNHGKWPETDEKIQTGEIKNQAYQAFMSAIDLGNRTLLEQQKGSLNHLKLNLNLSFSARSELNDVWNYDRNKMEV